MASREAAAQRVITEVREAAKTQREHLEKAREEVRKLAEETRLRSERISTALAAHLLGIETLVDRISTGEQVMLEAAKLMGDARSSLTRSLEELNKSLERVESAPQIIPATGVTAPASVTSESSSNNNLPM